MTSGPHTFATLSVFSPSRFEGSRATIIAARGPRDLLPLESTRRGDFAAEFNTDTVAFIYDATALHQPRLLDVYVRYHEDLNAPPRSRYRRWTERGFDINGILAATHYIFTHVERRTVFSIVEASERGNEKQVALFRLPQSGLDVLVSFNPYRQVAGCLVPNIAKLLTLDGPKISWTKILETHRHSKNLAKIEKLGEGEGKSREYPVVSLGEQSWVLVDVSDHADVLGSVEPYCLEVDGKVNGLVWFVQQKSQVDKSGEPVIEALNIRVMNNGWEEEAGANAAVALSAWLSLKPEEELVGKVERLSVTDSKDENEKNGKPSERRVFGVQTGSKIRRPGTILVEVDVKADKENSKKTIDSIVVSGRANFLSTGQLLGT